MYIMEPQNNDKPITRKLNDPYFDTHFITKDTLISIPISFKISGTQSQLSRFEDEFIKYFNKDYIKLDSKSTQNNNNKIKLKKQHQTKKHNNRLF